ncbi:hypothetical protein RU639_005394 [Aspergillus parasiticus]
MEQFFLYIRRTPPEKRTLPVIRSETVHASGSLNNKTTYYYTSSPEAQACVLKIGGPTNVSERDGERQTCKRIIDRQPLIQGIVIYTMTWLTPQQVMRHTNLYVTYPDIGTLRTMSLGQSQADSRTTVLGPYHRSEEPGLRSRPISDQ